ncbi:family 62 putative glycoside hydrolase [Podospora australis]|uniref:Alpha-L-arabinofuranosidase n=1 Tax=Podospora australis TaxID=1536484 RepID=A0AAN7AFV8_9PEZI|nr:family 62 putative glycoside hydrolase [Podospora australis]
MRILTALTALWATTLALPSTNPPPSISLNSRQGGALGSKPTSFEWQSTGPLVSAKNDGRGIAGIKDPSIVLINGTYHVFASTAQSSGYNLVYFSFKDFAQAGNAKFHYLDQAPLGTGYRAAPQVFYFTPHKTWYLIYQNGNAAYSTNKNISDPLGWTAPQVFYPAGRPKIIDDNIGAGYWVDMWVICDDKDCHLFSSDDNGQLYRSQTTLANFPNGMSQPVIALQDKKNDLFEASCVYTWGDGFADGTKYLLLVEAIDPDGNRWFRSWTSASISGPWKGLANTMENPFARWNNVKFPDDKVWTWSISHGELVRTDTDEKLRIDPCSMDFLYQGIGPDADWSDYNALPWKLGLITLRNSVCG